MINMTFEKNIKLLEKYYPKIYEKIRGLGDIRSKGYEVVYSKSLAPTLKVTNEGGQFYLHSMYDVEKEAVRFIGEHYSVETQTYIMYGIGFLYHIKEIIKRNKCINLYIFESNKYIFMAAVENIDFQDILQQPNVKIFLEETVDGFVRQFEEVLGNSEEKEVIIHLPSLKAMPKEFLEIRYLLENYRVHQNTVNNHADRLLFNFNENIKGYDKLVNILFGKFSDIPTIIVAAGPSLDKNKDILKKAKNKALILAVGTSVKPLLNIGVYPDLIIITDPTDLVYGQVKDLDISIPIIILSTCNHQVMKNYRGIKMLALQQGFPEAENFAKKIGVETVRTGGSVATTALDIVLRLGGNPVIFAGLDLAFTGGHSHAKGAHLYKEISTTQGLREIKGYDGSQVLTGKNLYIFLKWIEKRITEEKNTLFINATEGGAFIEGAINMTLQDVTSKFLKGNNYYFDSLINRLIENV